jgi:ABC-type sugar transport system ATPase subunit
MAFIEIQNIAKSFRSDKGVRHVLENVNLSVEEAEEEIRRAKEQTTEGI